MAFPFSSFCPCRTLQPRKEWGEKPTHFGCHALQEEALWQGGTPEDGLIGQISHMDFLVGDSPDLASARRSAECQTAMCAITGARR